jgi:primosomal protein N' (replication factor Y)
MPGQGTERLELALRGLFPEFALERIDRDTTRRKGELEGKLARAHSGEARILLGTQMLAKGHDFPGVTLAVILDADSGLMSSDFRAPERLVQLIVQVAGRAGRADKPGEVLIQTHQPEHPLLQALLHGGFERCAEVLMRERELARLPPFAHLALLRAEAKDALRAQAFLARCAAFFKDETTETLQVWGPAPAPLERRAGRFRFQLLLVAAQRAPLHRAIEQFAVAQAAWTERRGVKWSLDIDPQEMG